jgi:hypothetical protein
MTTTGTREARPPVVQENAWYPEAGQRAVAVIATRICGHCALSGADTWGGIATGIWGGTTPRDRGRLRRQRTAVAA